MVCVPHPMLSSEGLRVPGTLAPTALLPDIEGTQCYLPGLREAPLPGRCNAYDALGSTVLLWIREGLILWLHPNPTVQAVPSTPITSWLQGTSPCAPEAAQPPSWFLGALQQAGSDLGWLKPGSFRGALLS